MPSRLNPYLSFKDNARQAMQFYETVFGGKLTVQTFKDMNAADNPADEDLIMHATLEINDTMTIMASDTPRNMEYKPGNNFSLSVSGTDEVELREYYGKLVVDGRIIMPLDKAMWGDYFGMLTDKFGVTWMINITQP